MNNMQIFQVSLEASSLLPMPRKACFSNSNQSNPDKIHVRFHHSSAHDPSSGRSHPTQRKGQDLPAPYSTPRYLVPAPPVSLTSKIFPFSLLFSHTGCSTLVLKQAKTFLPQDLFTCCSLCVTHSLLTLLLGSPPHLLQLSPAQGSPSL